MLSTPSAIGMNLKEIVKKLEIFAPLHLAGSWDNVGLLIEPSGEKIVKKIFLTNDLTEPVMEESIKVNTDMIFSYHPPIFRPLKRLTSSSWKERIVTKCLENRIALYSPHTSFDAIPNGVNDWLISPFGKGSVTPLLQSYEKGQKYFIPGDQNDDKIDRIVSQKDIKSGNTTQIIKMEKVALPLTGAGRLLKLEQGMPLAEALEVIKNHLKLSHVRLAIANNATKDSIIGSIAVCAGSGSSVLEGSKADLWITGEMSHHEVLDAVHNGTSIILCDHSNTERGFLKVFASELSNILNNAVSVQVSDLDADPLQIV